MLNFNNAEVTISEEDLKDIRALNIINYTKLIIDRALSGYYGFKRLVNPGDTLTPDSGYKFCVIYAIEDSIVSVVGNSTVSNQVLKKNQMLLGRFTSITITPGSYINAYQIPVGA